MIEVRSLRKSFDGFTALDGLDISVPDGAVYGLVGPNGAGKSTLIRHLAGILRQDAGEVLYDGEAVFENPAVKAQIAYIPDAVFYYPGASIKDMMLLYRRMYPSFSEERYNRLAPAFGIAPERSFKRLSKGVQKQAAFWLALSLCPKYMLLDEPLDGLDPVMRRQVMKLLLADVAERGTTVLVSSHNLRELEDVCDHVGIMNGGRMLLQRPLSELQDSTVKVQLALPEGRKLPEGLDILHSSVTGSLYQLIVRGSTGEVTNILSTAEPFFIDVLPMSLEEIFIYELGGGDSEVRDIIL